VSAPPANRKSSPAAATAALRYEFDGFTLDAVRRVLQADGEPVAIPSRAFDVLLYLIENRDRCVRKDEIITAIWNDVVVTDDSLIHAISVLRRALGDGRKQPRFIQTVPRRGYRFVAAVRPVVDPGVVDPGVADPGTPSSEAAGTGAAASAGADATRAMRGDARDEAAVAGRFGLGRTGWLALAAGATLAVVAVSALLVEREPPASAAQPAARIQLFQPAPEGTSIVSGGVLSPDGRYLAIVASDHVSGQTGLWIRSLQTTELRRLPNTTGASKPFWSPDARQLGYFANGKLVAIDLASETTRTIAPVFAAAGGSWGSDDTILFAEWASGLFTVPASGDGNVRTVATLDRDADDIAFAWPQFLPDNRRFIYQIVSLDAARSGVFVGNIDGTPSSKLLHTTSSATLAPPNRLLHVKNDLLIAEELDLDRVELTGRAVIVARGLSETSLSAENIVSASSDLLAFRHGITRQTLSWYDRSGNEVGTLAMPTVLFNPRVSPDGSQLLGSGSVTTDPGLWLVRLGDDEYARIETDAMGPIWSPDGRQVAMTSRDGSELIVRAVDDASERRVLARGGGVKILNDWSPDGRQIVYTRRGDSTHLDLWIIDTFTGATRPLLATAHSETQARISPDGNWIAYASDESGVLETYVARFQDMSEPQKVSIGGGGEPQWRADQRELFYLSLDQTVTSVAIETGEGLRFGDPQQLFRASLAGDPGDARDYFAASADGQRFLVDSAVSEDGSDAITVMVNWESGMPGTAAESPRLSQASP
jgi:DNA-binding winged helix-turn-helix (wHTH) protein